MKMKKVLLGIASLLALHFTAQAQQQGQYSQYMLNYFLINPAVAGTEDFLDIRLGYRNQWSGLSGAPKNYYVSGHMPLNKIHDRHDRKFHNKMTEPYHVLGGMVTGQNAGAISQNSAYITYAFHLPLTKVWTMSMGAMAGAIQYRLNSEKLDYGDNMGDNATTNYNNTIKPDLGLGVWLYSRKYFVGLSTMQLFSNRFGNGQDPGRLERHFYLTGGTNIKLNRELQLVPSLLLRTALPNAYQVDLNAKLKFMNLCWAGVSYRHQDAVVILAGANIKNTFEIGYSYDITTSGLNKYSNGTHELMLAFKLNTQAQIHSPSDFW